MKYKKNIRGAINDVTHVVHSDNLRCIDAKMHRGKVDYGNKNCHTEDKSPKYRIVGNVCSSLRANAKQSSETVITRSDERRSNLIHNEKDEIGATHVALCDNVGDICTDYLKSFSGSINVANTILEPLTRISNAHIHSQRTAPSPTRGEGKEGSVGNMHQNNFADKVNSLFSTHHSLIHNDTDFSLKRTAFTLAEVLITLGIIGVVVAMTMPSLINNYQKKLAVTRLKHFSSMMQQAAKMRDKDIMEGDFVEMQPKEVKAYNPDDIEKFYKQYWLPYVKTVNMTKLTKGLLVEYANGSGAYFQKTYVAPNETGVEANSYVIFCPEYKYCKDIDNTYSAAGSVDGRHSFTLWNGGTVPLEFTYMPYSREQLVDRCKTQKYYCSSLIYFDGWQISKDYPW